MQGRPRSPCCARSALPRRLCQPFVEYADVVRPLIMADPKKNWPLVNDEEFAFFADLHQRLDAMAQSARSSAPAAENPAESLELNVPTNREVELLASLDSGLSNHEIADRLGLIVGTVKWHLHNLFMALRVRNRSVAIFKAKRAGLLNRCPPPPGRDRARSTPAAPQHDAAAYTYALGATVEEHGSERRRQRSASVHDARQ